MNTHVHAEYLAEMVRQALAEHYPEEVYTRGFRDYTTIRKADQEAAYEALSKGVLEYDRRQGYRRPGGLHELPAKPRATTTTTTRWPITRTATICSRRWCTADAKQVEAALRTGEKIAITGEALRFAARALDPKTAPQKRIRRGTIIRVQRDGKASWHIVQLPEVEAAFISLDPQDGAVRALVGGFDFRRNKFNHVTQAWRQPGSSFKPFIYSAALEKGFTAGDRDRRTSRSCSKQSRPAASAGSPRTTTASSKGRCACVPRSPSRRTWSRSASSRRSGRSTRRNTSRVSASTPEKHPPYLTMALGAGSVTAWQMARAYSVFANGGYLVQPYFIHKVVDDRGNVARARQAPRARATRRCGSSMRATPSSWTTCCRT